MQEVSEKRYIDHADHVQRPRLLRHGCYKAYLGDGLQHFESPDERIRQTIDNLKRLYSFE
jgi:hypothetical protein